MSSMHRVDTAGRYNRFKIRLSGGMFRVICFTENWCIARVSLDSQIVPLLKVSNDAFIQNFDKKD